MNKKKRKSIEKEQETHIDIGTHWYALKPLKPQNDKS